MGRAFCWICRCRRPRLRQGIGGPSSKVPGCAPNARSAGRSHMRCWSRPRRCLRKVLGSQPKGPVFCCWILWPGRVSVPWSRCLRPQSWPRIWRPGRKVLNRVFCMPKMFFIERDGTRREVDAPLGLSVLEIAHRNKIDIEGACEGSLACSTCHVVVDPEWYELLKDASEDEEDMLDLAFGLTVTSRLGCQIIMTEELDGLTVRLPASTRNMLLG